MAKKKTEHDFQDMKYNPLEVPKGSTVLEHFPDLKRYHPLTKDVPSIGNDKALRYSLFIADQKAPIIDVQDEGEKRILAAQWAGVTQKEFRTPPVKELVSEKGRPETDRMILCLLELIKNKKYSIWYTTRLNYFMINEQMLERPDIGSQKDYSHRLEAVKQLKSLAQEVDAAENDLFHGETDRESANRGLVEKFFAEHFAEEKSVE